MPGEFMVGRHAHEPGFDEQGRADGEVGLLDRKPGDEDVVLATAEPGERVDEGRKPEAQFPLRVAGPEGFPIRP
ncbi:hypothetical protein [Plantactinospora sp. B24E8]|uniref:hypothetical protein n=1 Tax=Plantactinospora sp. B24E8 TaxID=3153567 RepID=UPI00325F4EB0